MRSEENVVLTDPDLVHLGLEPAPELGHDPGHFPDPDTDPIHGQDQEVVALIVGHLEGTHPDDQDHLVTQDLLATPDRHDVHGHLDDPILQEGRGQGIGRSPGHQSGGGQGHVRLDGHIRAALLEGLPIGVDHVHKDDFLRHADPPSGDRQVVAPGLEIVDHGHEILSQSENQFLPGLGRLYLRAGGHHHPGRHLLKTTRTSARQSLQGEDLLDNLLWGTRRTFPETRFRTKEITSQSL